MWAEQYAATAIGSRWRAGVSTSTERWAATTRRGSPTGKRWRPKPEELFPSRQLVDDRGQRVEVHRSRLVEEDGVGDTVDAVANVSRDVRRGAAGRDGVQHLVVYQSAHVLPAAPLGQCVLLGVQGL